MLFWVRYVAKIKAAVIKDAETYKLGIKALHLLSSLFYANKHIMVKIFKQSSNNDKTYLLLNINKEMVRWRFCNASAILGNFFRFS